MKKAVIVLLEIAILFMLLRSPFVQYLFTDIQQTVSGWFLSLGKMQEVRELQALNDSIAPHVQSLNSYQQDYIADITSDKYKLQKFHHLYCVNKDKNPYVYGSTLLFLCGEISRVTPPNQMR